jgi:hypothetical protein
MDHTSTPRLKPSVSQIEALLREDFRDLAESFFIPAVSLRDQRVLNSYLVTGMSEEWADRPTVERSWLVTGTSEYPWLSATCVPGTLWGTGSIYATEHVGAHGYYWPAQFELNQFVGSCVLGVSYAVTFPVPMVGVPAQKIPRPTPWGLTAEGYDFYFHWTRHSDKSLRHVVDTFRGLRRPRRRATNRVPTKKMRSGLSGLKSRRRRCSARVFASRRLKRQSRQSAEIDASWDRSIERIWVRGHDQFRGLERLH